MIKKAITKQNTGSVLYLKIFVPPNISNPALQNAETECQNHI